jgi:hypothetical protein
MDKPLFMKAHIAIATADPMYEFRDAKTDWETNIST